MGIRKHQPNTGRKTALAVLTGLLLCFTAFFAWGVRANADETPPEGLTARIVKHDTACRYRYFDNPLSVSIYDGMFAVADGNKAYPFLHDAAGIEEKTARNLPADTRKFMQFGGKYLALANNTLYAENGNGTFDAIGAYSDFTILDNTLYAADGENAGEIFAYPLKDGIATDGKITATVCGRPILKLAADRTGVYFTAQSSLNKRWNDVFYVPLTDGATLGQAKSYLTVTTEILSLEGRDSGVICLTRGGITAYSPAGQALVKSKEYACADAVAIAANGDTVYGIGDDKNIFMLSADFTARTELLASAHGASGFYRANAGLSSRKQTIVVADELNNRVQVLTQKGTQTLAGTMDRPKAVAVDSTGKFYAAHSSNKISVYGADYAYTGTEYTVISAGSGITVTDLAIDSSDALYAKSADGQIYAAAAGAVTFEPVCTESNAVAMTLAQSDDGLYALTDDNRIVRITDKTQTEVLASVPASVDLCTDHDDSFYLLTVTGDIVRYPHTQSGYGAPVTYQTSDLFAGATRIAMNTAVFKENDSDMPLSYGDLLISDTGAHAVKVLDGFKLNVNENFSTDDTPPPVSDPDVPNVVSDRKIIYTVHGCDVYARAAELNAVASLREGMRVIIPHYAPDAKFNFIIADNISGGTDASPITGYIYTKNVRETLAYETPPSEVCYPHFPAVSVYKYPTRNLPEIASVHKGEKIKRLDFVYTDTLYGYTDNVNTIWYRITFTQNDVECEGYVIGDFMSMRDENPDDRNIYPRHNATVISKVKGKNLPAALYERDESGAFVAVADPAYAPLAVGTRVEVVGAFDSSEKYTPIRCYIEGNGTLPFYVETANLKYDGINKVTIIAIVIVILTVILGIILLLRFLHVKRTRRLRDSVHP